MLKLIIKEKGHMIDLPGMAQFRTPAEIDVSKIPLDTLILKMKVYNINEYEIISELNGKKIVYKKDDLEKKKIKEETKKRTKEIDQLSSLNKRFNRLENMFLKVIEHSKTNADLEQINEKLDMLFDKVEDQKILKEVIVSKENGDDDLDIIGDEVFIPTIDTENMKIRSKEHKTVERDDDVDDASDILSQLTKKKE